MLEDLKNLALKPSGWLQSLEEKRPVSQDGVPLPWFTYGAIEFLHRIVRPDDVVFEYGAGYSSLWWQERVRSLYSVEHDPEWAETLGPRLRENVHLVCHSQDEVFPEPWRERTEPFFARPRRTSWTYDSEKIIRRGLADEGFVSYATHIATLNRKFDFIVIDGMARRLCVFEAVNHLSENGFIVFDNSNRSDYDLAYSILEEQGFVQIPFWGLVPGATFMTCTSFFTKSLRRFPRANHVPNSFGLPEY